MYFDVDVHSGPAAICLASALQMRHDLTGRAAVRELQRHRVASAIALEAMTKRAEEAEFTLKIQQQKMEVRTALRCTV